MVANKAFGHHISRGVALLAFLQAGIAFGAIYLATWLRLYHSAHLDQFLHKLLPNALIFTLGATICLAAVGLYRQQLRGTVDQIIMQVLVGIGLAALFLAVIYYVLPGLYLGRGIVAIAVLLAFVGIAGTHVIFISMLDQETFKRRILIYGAGENALSLLERMQRKADRRLFRVVACVPVTGEPLSVLNERIRALPDSDDLRSLANQERIDEIVVVPDERRRALPLETLLKLRLEGVRVSDAVTFYERYMGKLKTDLMSPGWIIFSDGFEQGWKRQVIKRAFDLTASLVMLLIFWPFMLLTICAIWLEEGIRAPVLYRQTRVGLNGAPFRILKFRSMRIDAEADGKARWATTKDSRVTRVGAFIRKYRLDELPQLFNVLSGQMSLVGPRPERPEFVEQLRHDIGYYDLRHRVRPGVTGWAQLSYPYGATDRDALEKLQYDLYYVKNANFILDMYILLGTVEVILLGKGGR